MLMQMQCREIESAGDHDVKLINNQAKLQEKRNNCQGWGKAQYLVLYYFIGQSAELMLQYQASFSSSPSLLRQQVCLNRARLLALCRRASYQKRA
mmetsp:Transcript_11863/g.17019  ORF Transcript_11863/g.17019 Transcript_11863/m.17019 type:complete len:95 (+) Transcript_11863:493-777(+)